MRRILWALTLALVAGVPAWAQSWPEKPVRFIVPFPPGGTVDPLARLMGVKLGEALGQQFIVENRPGAGGSIGTAAAAKSAPDGYTFVFVFDSHAVNQALFKKLQFDTLRDLAPVMLVGRAPYAIAANPSRPYRSFADVVAAAKEKPDSISIGSIGNGTLGHLTVLLAHKAAGFRLTHVPYAGGGPMTQNLLGGQIDLGIGSVALLSRHVRAGKVRALATTGEKRSPALPDTPTLGEQGVPGVVAYAWWGIFAPAGTPQPVIDRFHGELVKALDLPDVKKTLGESLSMEVVAASPEETRKFLVREMELWGRVVKENGISAD